MVPLMSLLLPILLAAVLVFVASSVIHMLLPYHRSDFAKVPMEDEVMAAMRPFAIPPGEYVMPYAGSPAMMKDPGYIEKVKAGPAAFMTVAPSAVPTMGAQLALWFAYCVVVGVFRRIRDGARAASGRRRPASLPIFRNSGVHQLHRRRLAEFDLVPACMEHHVQEHVRWTGLRATNSGGVFSIVARVAARRRVPAQARRGWGRVWWTTRAENRWPRADDSMPRETATDPTQASLPAGATAATAVSPPAGLGMRHRT